ncbi:Acg family FMN-binding oxidoreductase [Streptococcus dentiloxodontae]
MRKRMLKLVFFVSSLLIVGGSTILFMLGKPAETKTNTNLKGVSSDIEQVLYYASFAANSHNTQSWKMTLEPKQEKMNIFLDKKRTLDVVDPNNRELYISIGCYIQSLKASFAAHGYRVNIHKISPNNENHYQVASVNYKKSKDKQTNTKQLAILKKRHTDKRKFESKKLDAKVISNLIQKYDSISYYTSGSPEFHYLQKGSLAAAKEQYQDKDYLAEQNKWLRFSNQEAEQKKDGISGDMLGLNLFVKSLYYLTSNHQNATSSSFVRQSIKTMTNQVNNCGGFFIITGQQTTSDWISVGEQTQAFWYDCTKNNIAIQPISAMIEVNTYNQNLQKDLNLSQPVQMILRAGSVKNYGQNTGLRRNLDDYITVINS